jgi:TonB family protein
MYFDFEDGRPDIAPVGRELRPHEEAQPLRLSVGPVTVQVARGWRWGGPSSRQIAVLASLALHIAMWTFVFEAPKLFPQSAEAERARLALLEQQRQRDDTTFVFVQPRLDTTAPKPPDVDELSDKDRQARALERALNPTNPLPFARGNTPERVEAAPPESPARGQGPAPDPAAGQQASPDQQLAESPSALQSPFPPLPSPSGVGGRSATPGGSLGESLQNLTRFIQSDSFDNPKGGNNEFGPAIQFDTKGVEFGPWIRRFVAQVKRNWFVPNAAMMGIKGHVVITFNVHKSGVITDLTVIGPCPIEAFNSAAFGALLSSNPTQPLPPEYPSEKAFFTVTFFYNEPVQ